MKVQESHTSSKSVAPANIRLRPMQESDLPDVHQLEVMSQPIPWPRWFFRRQLRKGASCWVLEEGNKIVGFGIIAFEGLGAYNEYVRGTRLSPTRFGTTHYAALVGLGR